MKGWFRRHALRRPAGPPESQPADADDLPRATTEPVVQDDLWERCPQCREILYARELHGNLQVCPKCGHHGRLTAPERLAQLTDPGTWREFDADLTAADPIGFVRPGRESYAAKLDEEIAAHRKRTAGLLQEVGEQEVSPTLKITLYRQHGAELPPEIDGRMTKPGAAPLLREAAVYGTATIDGIPVVLAVMDPYFFAATMGAVVGEKIARAAELAGYFRQPLVVVAASGGARQDEGIFALLQMAKTTAALTQLAEARLPYLAILTDPTLAGVTASFASQADCIIAEPGAVIGFAGPRLIEQIMHEKLPADADTAEFQRTHGMVDMVVPRGALKARLGRVLRLYLDARAAAAATTGTDTTTILANS
ncbi:MAG: acetyl-CoA carboxylase carboxyltransferase subunit beta [Chloroflexota bacterium]|nr:acetyl-CoA carboxylase carboxyltransferase subunit beta [Chloroflexota bacterium]